MTQEQIKALISEKIAGQGNQVDIAGALPVILGEIVDAISALPAPLIVKGTIGGTKFIPDAGQPSFSEAVAAFLMGATVLVEFRPEASVVGKCTAKLYSFYDGEGDYTSNLAGDYAVDDGTLGNVVIWEY